jgi:hypothetical protein
MIHYIVATIIWFISFILIEVYYIKKSIQAFKDVKQAREDYKKSKDELMRFLK